MNWVRAYTFIQNWPGGAQPPSFKISADENGRAVIELAWDPQALMAPGTYTPNPLRYYSSDMPFNETLTNDDGSSRQVSVPAQTIQLSDNRASWTMPAALWEAYVQESLKTLGNPPRTTFSRNIYYRVRATAPGASAACIWPEDAVLSGPNATVAPHMGILPISATPSSQVLPDSAAVQAMGGIPVIAPNLWSDILTWLWRNLPESDPDRQVLARIFAHESFTTADQATRAAILKLWLFAGPTARPRLPDLLIRRTVTGSNVTQPIITKQALRGGKTLAQNLLDLLSITPHPDMGVTSHEQLLDDVITEILDPNGRVNQGPAGTCVPTSIQTLLITINPAEYARLQVGLLSNSGSATLANGDTASLPPAVLQLDQYKTAVGGQAFLVRTYSELAFQAAILKYGQGSRFPAYDGTPQSINRIIQAVIVGGLSVSENNRALDGVCGVRFTPQFTPASSQQAVRDGLVTDLPARQQQLLIWLYWNAPYGNPSPPGGLHAVLALRREAAARRVFYKNPQYPGSSPPGWVVAGGNANNPPRRYDDPTQALESIAEADLQTWIVGYFVPDTAIV